MTEYRVGVPVTARDPKEAASFIIDALGADAISINDIGGLTVETVPDSPLVLACRGCEEVFDSMTAAHEHGVYIPGPDPQWCGEAGFDLAPKEML